MAVDPRPSTAWNSRAFHLELRYSGDAPADAPRRAVTLSHGDCYFIQFLCPRQAGSGATYLIDFDSVSTNLPAYDLVYMFATFWTSEQRLAGERETQLLRRYHAGLTTYGVRGYSWSDLQQDYRL